MDGRARPKMREGWLNARRSGGVREWIEAISSPFSRSNQSLCEIERIFTDERLKIRLQYPEHDIVVIDESLIDHLRHFDSTSRDLPSSLPSTPIQRQNAREPDEQRVMRAIVFVISMILWSFGSRPTLAFSSSVCMSRNTIPRQNKALNDIQRMQNEQFLQSTFLAMDDSSEDTEPTESPFKFSFEYSGNPRRCVGCGTLWTSMSSLLF